MGEYPERHSVLPHPAILAHINALQILALAAPEVTQALLLQTENLARDVGTTGALDPHVEKGLLQLLHLWTVIARPTETAAPKPVPAKAGLRLVEKRA